MSNRLHGGDLVGGQHWQSNACSYSQMVDLHDLDPTNLSMLALACQTGAAQLVINLYNAL